MRRPHEGGEAGDGIRDLAAGLSRSQVQLSAVPSQASPHKRRGAQEEAGMKRIVGYLKDEQGIETLEWIAVGALIVAVALVVYPGTLQGGLQSVINTVVSKINT